MIRLLFGSYLSEVNQYIPFWYYGILLPKHEGISLSSLMNKSLDGLIYYQRDTVKLHLNYWKTFMLENYIYKYYFDKFNVTRFNIYHIKMYYIGIGIECDYYLTHNIQRR